VRMGREYRTCPAGWPGVSEYINSA
jgi:hypothetical protein